jgi:hypothetical protein
MSSALETIDDYVDDARVLLLDTVSPYRYSDASLVVAMNVTLLEARRLRADLFLYNRYGSGQKGVQSFQSVDGTKVQMEEPFRLAILHGMIAHALERDQEDIQDARAGVFMGVFNTMLVGRATSAPAPTPGAA